MASAWVIMRCRCLCVVKSFCVCVSADIEREGAHMQTDGGKVIVFHPV